MENPKKAKEIVDHYPCEAFEVVQKYETIDDMWGIEHIAITDDNIKALKKGKYLYHNDGEYVQVISYKEK